ASGGVSIAALFLAGYLPGILVGLMLMAVAGYYAFKNKYPVGEAFAWRPALSAFVDAVPSLLLIIVVIGGMVAGYFTATEASAVAVFYTLVLGFIYREVNWRKLPGIMLATVGTTSIVMLLIGTSMSMSWVMAYENIPQNVSEALLSISDNKIVVLLIINFILLVVGTFMDMTPAVLIFTPIFLPIVTAPGIDMDPTHFGIVMVLNLCIGICTPPVGSVLFVGAAVAQRKISQVIRPLLPLFVAMIIALIIVSYVPWLSLWLPRVFGY
ncbi:MAG: TRAP transporter large permease, partial [Bacteroidetes bacterium]